MLNLWFAFELQNCVCPSLTVLCIRLCLGWALLEGADHSVLKDGLAARTVF